jgi:hypothetical protein
VTGAARAATRSARTAVRKVKRGSNRRSRSRK